MTSKVDILLSCSQRSSNKCSQGAGSVPTKCRNEMPATPLYTNTSLNLGCVLLDYLKGALSLTFKLNYTQPSCGECKFFHIS